MPKLQLRTNEAVTNSGCEWNQAPENGGHIEAVMVGFKQHLSFRLGFQLAEPTVEYRRVPMHLSGWMWRSVRDIC